MRICAVEPISILMHDLQTFLFFLTIFFTILCLHSPSLYIYAHEYTGEEQLMQPGIYTYPFEESLPVGLPSSITTEHGNVEYKTSVTVNRPEAVDQSFGQTFTVVKPFDLSNDPSLRVSGVGNFID